MASRFYLYLTAFAAGAAVLVLEILGTRIIAPYYGTTVYVWSSLISVTLFSLAAGYFLGGLVCDRLPEERVLYLIILAASPATYLISWLSTPVLEFTEPYGHRWGALLASAVLFTLPLMLLGMVAPYAVKLGTRKLKGVGVSAGSLYGVSTLGSLSGAIAAGFYLIPAVGLDAVLYLTSCLLFTVSLIWFLMNHAGREAALALILLSPLILLPEPADAGELKPGVTIVYATESPYARLRVVDNNGFRYLMVDGAPHTRYDLGRGRFIFGYLFLFEKAVHYHGGVHDVLVVGLGGGGVDDRLRDYNLSIDNVEVDPEVVRIARQYFGFEGGVVLDDGRHFIRTTPKRYDIVYLDVYNGYSIYPYLFSREAFTEVGDVMNPGGILVLNAVGYVEGDTTEDELLMSVDATLRRVFPYVYARAIGAGFSNVVFYASNRPLAVDNTFIPLSVTEGRLVLSDDLNPIDYIIAESVGEWRRVSLDNFGQVFA